MDPLEKLRKKIKLYKARDQQQQQKNDSTNLSALNVSAEIVGAVIVGFVLGAFFDDIFNTKFIFKFIMLVLALASSFYTIYKIMNKR